MRIFLSYNSPDRCTATRLKEAIESGLPGADVFLDQTDLRLGHLWGQQLFEAIANSDAFLVLVGNGIGDWQLMEYSVAQDRKAKEQATFLLLPIIIADKSKGPPPNFPGLSLLHWIETANPSAPAPLERILAALSGAPVRQPIEPWRTINPYKGLFALQEQDADFFFGRNQETREILQAIGAREQRLIALIGSSGVGKSSLMQAGATGSLKRQRWPGGGPWPKALDDSRTWVYLTMRPGDEPIIALAGAFIATWFDDPAKAERIEQRAHWERLLRQGQATLGDLIDATTQRLAKNGGAHPPRRVLLHIDQGEELYSLASAEVAALFSEIIAHGVSDPRISILTTHRADFYGALQANGALFPITHRIDVAPLAEDALQTVLEGPAHVLGASIDGNVAGLIRVAERGHGALPLLADLMNQYWSEMQDRGDGCLRIPEVADLGAELAKRADLFLHSHGEQQEQARRLFTRDLVLLQEEGEPLRRRLMIDVDDAGNLLHSDWPLIEMLAGPQWRLLVIGEENGQVTVEVTHEVMLRAWGTLKGWLTEKRGDLILRGRIENAYKLFIDAPKGAGSAHWLPRHLLEDAEKLLERSPEILKPDTRHFIEWSRVHYDRRTIMRSQLVALRGFAVFAAFLFPNMLVPGDQIHLFKLLYDYVTWKWAGPVLLLVLYPVLALMVRPLWRMLKHGATGQAAALRAKEDD